MNSQFIKYSPAENLPPFVGPLKDDEDEEYRNINKKGLLALLFKS